MAVQDPQLYTLIYVLADSALLSEEASVSMSRETGSSPAKTVAKHADGFRTMVEGMVPAGK